MNIIVQKYGGTSVADKNTRDIIAKRAVNLSNDGYKVVIVVSAIGRNGDPYATDTLINVLKSANENVNARELDLIMSCGEIISSTIMANTIRKYGKNAISLTGFQAGIITDNNFSSAEVIRVNPDRILRLLENDNIVVVTGFQGITEDGEITTLGRGGSDNTAAILGSVLNAESIEIYTDVDGVMTADPRIVEDAKVLDKLTYDEVYQMAIDGAKVVDHKAVEVAKLHGKKLKIKNTFTDSKGTIIGDIEGEKIERENLITSITSKSDIIQYIIYVHTSDIKNEELLVAMENNSISMDMINFFEDKKIFTIEEFNKEKLNGILENLGLEYKTIENCSKIAVIGHRINGIPGVMKRIVLALSKEGIEILQSSDSNTTIWCLVESSNKNKAIKILHKTFS